MRHRPDENDDVNSSIHYLYVHPHALTHTHPLHLSLCVHKYGLVCGAADNIDAHPHARVFPDPWAQRARLSLDSTMLVKE